LYFFHELCKIPVQKGQAQGIYPFAACAIHQQRTKASVIVLVIQDAYFGLHRLMDVHIDDLLQVTQIIFYHRLVLQDLPQLFQLLDDMIKVLNRVKRQVQPARQPARPWPRASKSALPPGRCHRTVSGEVFHPFSKAVTVS
jgi:hypothetical protein